MCRLNPFRISRIQKRIVPLTSATPTIASPTSVTWRTGSRAASASTPARSSHGTTAPSADAATTSVSPPASDPRYGR